MFIIGKIRDELPPLPPPGEDAAEAGEETTGVVIFPAKLLKWFTLKVNVLPEQTAFAHAGFVASLHTLPCVATRVLFFVNIG